MDVRTHCTECVKFGPLSDGMNSVKIHSASFVTLVSWQQLWQGIQNNTTATPQLCLWQCWVNATAMNLPRVKVVTTRLVRQPCVTCTFTRTLYETVTVVTWLLQPAAGIKVNVQRFSKFLQHPVARARTMPSNQIAEGFEFCSLIGSHGWRCCNRKLQELGKALYKSKSLGPLQNLKMSNEIAKRRLLE